MDGDQKKVRGVEIVETMLRIIKDKLEIELCDEVYFVLPFREAFVSKKVQLF